MRATVGLDVGGTKIAGGLVSETGQLLHEIVRPCPAGGDPGLRGTLAVAAELVREAGERGIELLAVGAGFPEYVDPDGRLTSREVLAWSQQPAALLAAVATGRPCVVDADVRCGALAESRLGAGAGCESFLYVSLGTGLSSALVVGGRPLPGHRGEAIALNEFDVPAHVQPPPAGNLEAYCSGAGVRARYAALAGEDPGDAREVVARAVAGDAHAAAILASAGTALGHVLGRLVGVLDPEAVVLGGGLGSADGPLHAALAEAFAAATARRPDPPPLRTAQLGARAGLVGAALRALP
jgi:glucokinase